MTPRIQHFYRKWLRRSYFRAVWVWGRCVIWPERVYSLWRWQQLVIRSEYDVFHRRTIEMMIEVMDKPSWTKRDLQHLIAIQLRFQSTIRSLKRLGELK